VNVASEELNGETWVCCTADAVIYEVCLGKTHDTVICTFEYPCVRCISFLIFFSNKFDSCNETLLVKHLPSHFAFSSRPDDFVTKLVKVDVRFAIEEVFHVELLADDLSFFRVLEHWPELFHLFFSCKLFDVFLRIEVNFVLEFTEVDVFIFNTLIIFQNMCCVRNILLA